MIPCGGSNYSCAGRVFSFEGLHVYYTSSDFEGTCWRMIFMFNPNFTTGVVREEWPGMLRGGLYNFMY